VKPRAVEGLDPAEPLRPNAARMIRTRLGELLSLAGPALEPEASAAQHDLRIAAKRLRYLLEIAGACFGPEAKAARDAAKGLQGVLGEIHDCDVMLPRAAGIVSLEALLHTRRELLFRRFGESWEAEARKGTWASLEHALPPPGSLKADI
jgi:CHAD domain-containing protein